MSASRPPIILSSEVTVPVVSDAETAGAIPFDLAALTNTYRVPMEVREIHWTVVTPGVAETSRAATPGAFIAATLASGKDILTRDFTHLAMMGRAYGASSGALSGGGGELETEFLVSAGHYRWVFPRPMILLPGQGVRAYVRFDIPTSLVGGISAAVTSVTVTISIVGRYFAGALPAVRCVPYVSEFVASAARSASLAEELYNPFASPLQVQRFLARIIARAADFPAGPNVGSILDATIGLGSIGQNPLDPVTVSMDAPGGYEAFPGVLPLTQVFFPQSRMWQVPHVVEGRNAWHSIKVESFGSSGLAKAVYFSMVGHREERL